MEFSAKFKEMESFVNILQENICSELEKMDSAKFMEDIWERDEGGGGKTKVIEKGKVFEKGGVNVSTVFGEMTDNVAEQLNVEKQQFAATGLSIIIHPYSPRIPTIHMNIRLFELENGKSWFGGGMDLTPYYPHIEDFKFFHNRLKDACESAKENSYKNFKKNCDEYFTIKHRNEMRGIGGIFYDYIDAGEKHIFKLSKNIGESFLKIYMPIVKKRINENFSEEEKEFQLFRRGRYVEFNLIYDKGTLFGLKTGGRIESILISLPPKVTFEYSHTLKKGSPQQKMMDYYQPKSWI